MPQSIDTQLAELVDQDDVEDQPVSAAVNFSGNIVLIEGQQNVEVIQQAIEESSAFLKNFRRYMVND